MNPNNALFQVTPAYDEENDLFVFAESLSDALLKYRLAVVEAVNNDYEADGEKKRISMKDVEDPHAIVFVADSTGIIV